MEWLLNFIACFVLNCKMIRTQYCHSCAVSKLISLSHLWFAYAQAFSSCTTSITFFLNVMVIFGLLLAAQCRRILTSFISCIMAVYFVYECHGHLNHPDANCRVFYKFACSVHLWKLMSCSLPL
jgi:hypothetical protein